MTALPPVDLPAVHHRAQPPQRPKARDDFGKQVPQQRQATSSEKQPTAAAQTSAPAPAAAPKVAPEASVTLQSPDLEAMLHEALAPVKASLAMSGLSGRIYPESLRVIGYLSMLEGNVGVTTKASDAISLPLPEQAAMLPSPATISVVKAEATPRDDVHIDGQALMGASELDEGSAGSEAPAAIGQSTAASGAQVEWLHRLIRLEGDTATLWIRDFRLDDSQKHALATQLRDYARTTGSLVRRVMVNGEELWRAGAGKDANNKGVSYGG
jgi:hypothetical protein